MDKFLSKCIALCTIGGFFSNIAFSSLKSGEQFVEILLDKGDNSRNNGIQKPPKIDEKKAKRIFLEKRLKRIIRKLGKRKVEKAVQKIIEDPTLEDLTFLDKWESLLGEKNLAFLKEVVRKRASKKKDFSAIDQSIRQAIKAGDLEEVAKIFDDHLGQKWRDAETSRSMQKLLKSQAKYNLATLEQKCYKPHKQQTWLGYAVQEGQTQIVALLFIYGASYLTIDNPEEVTNPEEVIQAYIQMAADYKHLKMQKFLENFWEILNDPAKEEREFYKKYKQFPVFRKDPQKRNIAYAKEIDRELGEDNTQGLFS
ncbi:MAG: hypothetical protein LBS71_00650 [Puniceicoccales bacterium]|jgi:hypothetical protein|nr:hypothetical protein [Puniceicoccales bacterium]